MKRINQYKKLFNIEGDIDLNELKSSYRNLVKQWHPDKYVGDDAQKEEAETMSRQITDGYAFLVSIAPETIGKGLDEYNNTINNAFIDNLHHKSLLLEISFTDGATYEYFGVNSALYTKLLNADKMQRFARRNIFNSFTYRKSKKTLIQE